MKEETKYQMIEYTEICINITYRYYIIERQEFRKIDLLLTLDPR